MGKEKKDENEIVILKPIIQKYAFAQEFKGDDAKKVFNTVTKRILKDYKDIPVFNGDFEFNEKTQKINGSSLCLGILINNELRKKSLHLPSVIEGKVLDAYGKLTNGDYRDYGIAVYSYEEPNSKLAKELVKKASERNLELPLLIPFNALNFKKDRGKNISSIFLREETPDIITGEQARKYLREQFSDKGSTGVRRLYRNDVGSWAAGWNSLDYSVSNSLMDWVCGEAETPNLGDYILGEIRGGKTESNLKLYNPEQISRAMRNLNLAEWKTKSLLLELKKQS